FLIADQVTAHGNQGFRALRPKHREDSGIPRSPIEAGEDRFFDLESIQKVLEIDRKCRRLAVPNRRTRKKPRCAVTAKVRNDHPVAGRGQPGGDINEAMDVVRPAMQKDDNGTIGRASFRVADIQDASIDLLQWSERCMCSWLDYWQFCLRALCRRRT